jgi:hypothetical protein
MAERDATQRLLDRHLERFNAAIRTGDWAPMLELFTTDAALVFEGVPVGPFVGREAIEAAYRESPPDDEIDALGRPVPGPDGTFVVEYGWRRDGGRRAGLMRVTPTTDAAYIRRLVVTFE